MERNLRNIVNISETYSKEILRNFKKRKGRGLFILRKFFENLNENARKVKEKCRENLKEISLEFD